MTKQEWHDEANKRWWKMRRADRVRFVNKQPTCSLYGAKYLFLSKLLRSFMLSSNALHQAAWAYLEDWQFPKDSY